jgi:hypothetical protein
VVLVTEGAARDIADPEDRDDVACAVEIVRAPAAGDDAIVAAAAEHVAAGDRVFVVTSDRGLTERIEALTGDGDPAEVRPVRWLLDQLDQVPATQQTVPTPGR